MAKDKHDSSGGKGGSLSGESFLQKPEDPFLIDELAKYNDPLRRKSVAHWSVAWSDLMMTMFILFAVMYIYQLANREMLPGDGPGTTYLNDRSSGVVMDEGVIRESFPEIYEASRDILEDLAMVELVEDELVRIVLTNDLLFETGKAKLRPRATEVLQRVAIIIRQTPYMVNVVGHTDDVPVHTEQFPTNWELSAIRACVVTRYLSEQMKIPGSRFFISGHAYHQAINPNNSAGNRAQNRRVEIIITRDRPAAKAERIR